MTETDPLSILVVEDVEINQLLLTTILERVGHQVELAVDGGDAIRRVEAAMAEGRSFDIVLMDLQMPNVDGFEATRAIRGLGFDAADLPIIALTANDQADTIAACYDAGMQAHLAKPLSRTDLESALDHWAGRGRLPAARPAARDGAIDPALHGQYAERKAAVIAGLNAMIHDGRFDDDEAREISFELHKLAGIAGMFGEPRVGEVAAMLEGKIVEWTVPERQAQLADYAGRLLQAA